MSHISQQQTHLPNTQLGLRLCRVNGRSMRAELVPLPPEGLLLGSDQPPLQLDPQACVASQHALIRPSMPAGWTLEPATPALVCTINSRKLAWGERHLLQPGDSVELGLTRVQVEPLPTHEAFFSPMMDVGTTTAIPERHGETASTTQMPQQTDVTASIPATDVMNATDVTGAADFTDTSLCSLLNQDSASGHADAASALHQLVAAFDLPQSAPPHIVPAAPSPNVLPDAWPNVRPDVRPDAWSNVSSNVSPDIQINATPTDDILHELAAESRHALAGGLHTSPAPGSPFSADMAAGLSLEPFSDPFAVPTARTADHKDNLEDILHGPLSIDDVLQTLKAQTSARVSAAPNRAVFPDRADRADRAARADHTSHDTFADTADLETHAPLPDPLLLLAGTPSPSTMPTHLSALLHREHRTAGMHTPYKTPNTHKEGQ